MTISTAVDPSAVASVLGISVAYQNFGTGSAVRLPQIGYVVGQGNEAASYASAKFQASSAVDVGNRVGFGSPLHLSAVELFPADGDGLGTIPAWFYPLQAHGSGIAAVFDFTPSGAGTATATLRLRVGGILSKQFVVPATSTPAEIVALVIPAITAVPEMPVVPTDGTGKVVLTLKWKGVSGSALTVEVEGDLQGNIFTFAVDTAGAADPDIQPALDAMGNVWYTMLLNLLDGEDTAMLDQVSVAGEARWGALVRKPFVAFIGNVAATVAAATAVPETRKTDRVNAQLVAPASTDLPFRVAAREFAKVIKMANTNPPHDYLGQVATGLRPGPDADQWDYPKRNEAVTKGSSTITVEDDRVALGDVVTYYHPTGDPLPAYQFVVNIVKLQQVLFNLGLEFEQPEWKGAPLLADGDITTNPTAKQPKGARSAATAVVEDLGLDAVLTNVESTIPLIRAELGANPRRLELVVPVKLSGNTGIISVDVLFGFHVGT